MSLKAVVVDAYGTLYDIQSVAEVTEEAFPGYGELRRAARDVSEKMLIQQPKKLKADGLVKRTDYKEVPPRVDYSLTALGRSLAQALVPLCSWGQSTWRRAP
jgi:DNA-binding HxlR family transcriptional regulator